MESLTKAHTKGNLKPQVVAETGHFRWSVDEDATLAHVRAGLMKLGLVGLETAFLVSKIAWEYRRLLLGTLVAGVLAGAASNLMKPEPTLDKNTQPNPVQANSRSAVENSMKQQVVTVKPGDTLWGLLSDFLGTTDKLELDAIVKKMREKHGDRIDHLRPEEKIRLMRAADGSLEVHFLLGN